MIRHMGYIKDIKVPNKMKSKKPKAYKVLGMKEYYKQNKHFYGSIIVNSNLKILDGYVVYYTAKEMNIDRVPITILSVEDRIINFFKKFWKGR